MTAIVALTGVSAMFGAAEIECLVRTAADAVCGDRADLTSRQVELAQRVRDAEAQPEAERSAPAQRLVALAERLNVDPSGLDDHVHDLVSNIGSEINNGGLTAQIDYLLDEVGEAETEQRIRRASTDRRHRTPRP
jgi:hypothetical protein